LVSNHVAALNRRTLDGTWGKSDPKDAHNLCDLLERGHVLFYSRPDAPIPALRRLVRLLRQARTDRAACKVRFRNTLLPALGPAGEPLPSALVAALPGLLQRPCPASPAAPGRGRGRPRGERATREEAVPSPALPPALAFELTDLAARLIAVQARIATIEAELVRVARPLPAYPWLRSIPGLGPTVAAILLAEIGDIAWYTRFSQLRKLAGLDIIWVATGQWIGTARWRARREAMLAKRQGDRYAFLKANTELAAKLLPLSGGSGGVSGSTSRRGSARPRPGRRPPLSRRASAAPGPHHPVRGDRRSTTLAAARLVGPRAGGPCTAELGQAGGRDGRPPSGRSRR